MDLRDRAIGTYLILIGGSFVISTGMEANGSSFRNPIYEFVTTMQWFLILPPVIAAIICGVFWMSEKIYKSHEAKKAREALRLAALEEDARRIRVNEQREREGLKTQEENERTRAELEIAREKLAKQKANELRRRTTQEATKKALDDF